ncbi:hypothetical protein GCM10025876_08770 [Demequina litorisediminis]|uniref:SSD domain-containing protein n=1 Tax=Demequina litorisediminis TaxID=1849022 RepID=A0ABQ6I9Y0_9MICO|nr:hypothetical protein GCM10025876_08770 [Demequina litorisediminis]
MESIESAPLDGLDVYFSSDISTSVAGLLGVGEIVGVLLALVVLFVMMRVVWPALTPIITSVVGVGVGVAASLALSGSVDMSSVTPVLGVMLALAVGIDYALFIINRHRTNLKRGMDVHESIGLANGTAGNAVVFAGTTVLIALLALNVTGIPFIGVMGNVAAFCILIAVLVAITLVPAVLGLVGIKAISKRSRGRIGQAAEPEAPYTPMKTGRAWLNVLAGVAVLAVFAIPSFSMRLGLPSGDQDTPDSTSYQAYSTIDEKFGEGLNGTILVTASLPEALEGNDLLAAQVEVENAIMANDDVSAVAPAGTNEDGSFLAFQVIPLEGPNAESTEQLVHDLRDLSPLEDGTEIGVAGNASGNIDISEKALRRPAALPRGGGGSVARHPHRGVPLAPGARHRDARLCAEPLRGVRRRHRRVPVGLAVRHLRRPCTGTDPVVPADHADRNPVRSGDGLPGSSSPPVCERPSSTGLMHASPSPRACATDARS